MRLVRARELVEFESCCNACRLCGEIRLAQDDSERFRLVIEE